LYWLSYVYRRSKPKINVDVAFISIHVLTDTSVGHQPCNVCAKRYTMHASQCNAMQCKVRRRPFTALQYTQPHARTRSRTTHPAQGHDTRLQPGSVVLHARQSHQSIPTRVLSFIDTIDDTCNNVTITAVNCNVPIRVSQPKICAATGKRWNRNGRLNFAYLRH
jgi:hypothetical protein